MKERTMLDKPVIVGPEDLPPKQWRHRHVFLTKDRELWIEALRAANQMGLDGRTLTRADIIADRPMGEGGEAVRVELYWKRDPALQPYAGRSDAWTERWVERLRGMAGQIRSLQRQVRELKAQLAAPAVQSADAGVFEMKRTYIPQVVVSQAGANPDTTIGQMHNILRGNQRLSSPPRQDVFVAYVEIDAEGPASFAVLAVKGERYLRILNDAMRLIQAVEADAHEESRDDLK